VNAFDTLQPPAANAPRQTTSTTNLRRQYVAADVPAATDVLFVLPGRLAPTRTAPAAEGCRTVPPPMAMSMQEPGPGPAQPRRVSWRTFRQAGELRPACPHWADVILVILTVKMALVGNIHLAQQTHPGAGTWPSHSVIAGTRHTGRFPANVGVGHGTPLAVMALRPRQTIAIRLPVTTAGCWMRSGGYSVQFSFWVRFKFPFWTDLVPIWWTSTYDQPEGAIIAHEPEPASRGRLCPRRRPQ
jgi:hypothetical protein